MWSREASACSVGKGTPRWASRKAGSWANRGSTPSASRGGASPASPSTPSGLQQTSPQHTTTTTPTPTRLLLLLPSSFILHTRDMHEHPAFREALLAPRTATKLTDKQSPNFAVFMGSLPSFLCLINRVLLCYSCICVASCLHSSDSTYVWHSVV